MIKSLKALLQTPPSDDEETQRRSIRLAAAVLLVETARADFTEDITEMKKLKDLLKSSLQLRDDEVQSSTHVSAPSISSTVTALAPAQQS